MATIEADLQGGAGPAEATIGVWDRLRANRLAVAGLGIIAILVFFAVFADIVATQPVAGFFPDQARQPPSSQHWFGTDPLGRDLFSRIVHGARFSLIIGAVVTGVSLVIGITLGGIAGYFGGLADTVVGRGIDIVLGFPALLGPIIVVTSLGGSRISVMIALAAFGWVGMARLFRSSVISVRNAEFVEAARALGASNRRIFFRHVLPNAITPTLVYAFALIGSAIISEAALSFLGLGVQEPEPSWGLMIAKGRPLLTTAPHMVIFPSLALIFTSLGFILLGDGLRDALDPKLR
ncbi:MAG: ABC transporter permease [Actinomycetota bacterium]